MSESYVYSPLEEGQIRLLHLKVDESAPHGLVLGLDHAALGESHYTALSYTWGPPEPPDLDPSFEDKTHELKCGDGIIPVRQNLYDFLQRLRISGLAIPPLWIDAVCINQANLEEKSEQVLRMGQIYAAADKVWIWLGAREVSANVQQIIDEFIPAMLQDFKDRDNQYSFYRRRDILDEHSSAEIIQAIGFGKWRVWRVYWPQYADFLRRSWFSRGWTVQEAAVKAPEQSTVFAGSRTLSWVHLIEFGKLMGQSRWVYMLASRRRSYGLQNGLYNMDRRAFIEHAIRHGETRKALLQTYGPKTPEQLWYARFFEMVSHMRQLVVDNPRDHVYAYLGLMLQIAPPGISHGIVPDYRRDVEYTYKNFTKAIIRNIPYLVVLSLVEDSRYRRHIHLPSWVPDFSVSRGCNYLDNFDAAKTAGNSMSVPEIIEDRLLLRGARLTYVSRPGPSMESDKLPVYVVDTCLQSRQHPYTSQSMREAVGRTLLADSFRRSERRQQSERLRQWIHRGLSDLWHRQGEAQSELRAEVSRCLAPVADSRDLWKKWLPTLDEVQHSNRPIVHSDFQVRLETATLGRRLYTTTDGQIGLGPPSLNTGDEVWIFDAGKVPFVLRKNGNDGTYKLIGETYVHGIMHGQAMTDTFRSRFGQVTLV
ncbi:uncharacterized protein JN550_006582 [Neoarthrinium moseri]|uniref:uncharacterized protein n=1 Tax=Neoarthrinium moseri TaxID=1658444 RepID=UPI001FDCA122|nr:uncharacterized protein JN550_006582 [Neoarthrinium moseri]KAI1868094.1 hypothetical protein JN550_006582 [Neoarthrinium moseri]